MKRPAPEVEAIPIPPLRARVRIFVAKRGVIFRNVVFAYVDQQKNGISLGRNSRNDRLKLTITRAGWRWGKARNSCFLGGKGRGGDVAKEESKGRSVGGTNVVELRGRNWNIGGGGGGGGSYTRGHGINRYGQTACSTNYRSLITGGRDLSG